KDGIWLQGDGNADHLRMYDVHFNNVNQGGVALYLNNSQAVNNHLFGCNFHNMRGTGIKIDAGGPLTMYGGSITLFENSIFLDVTASGAEVGPQTGVYQFIGIKTEMHNFSTSDPDPMFA